LFGPREGNAFDLSSSLWSEDENVTERENESLVSPFNEEEIKTTLFQMKKKNKAACLDGFWIEFFQVCWSFIKNDMVELFASFHDQSMDIKRLNYGIITLLPKTKEAVRIKQFRPICLLNCIYKWFTKTLTLRLEPIIKRIIHISQATFIGGRNIMNNILALHGILIDTKRRGKIGIIVIPRSEK
jgi:hypothetical protein